MVKKEHKIKTVPSKQVDSSLSASSPGAACNKKYKGVRMRSWGSWVSEIRAPNQKTRIWLGSYSTAEAAARAYDAALLCLKGSSANLNFPMSASHYIPQDTVLSPKSIQRVAAAAANSFVDNATSASSPPPIVTPSSSSSSSSSSPPPSPSDQIDDGASFMSYSETRTTSCEERTNSLAMMESSWYSFEDLQSPKYMDQMLHGTFFDPPVVSDEAYEESDFSLWSFC